MIVSDLEYLRKLNKGVDNIDTLTAGPPLHLY